MLETNHYLLDHGHDNTEEAGQRLGVTLVPRYSVARELEEGLLTEVFPGMPIKDDEFCVYVKRERMKLPKVEAVISYLRRMFEELGEEL